MGMSTQKMSGGGRGLSFTKKRSTEDPGPLPKSPNRVFTEKEREELKEIFHEVLLEYGLVKRMEG